MASIRNLILILIISSCFIKTSAQTYVHIVTDRDNIYKIARIYGVTPLQILKINKMDTSNLKLMEHSILIIPDKNYNTSGSGGKIIKTIEHRIVKGESLYTIARKYGVTVYDLLLINPHLSRGNSLPVDEEMKIQVTLNAESQYSRQIIYLNGDLFKYNLIEIRDSTEFELVKDFNSTLDDRISSIYEAQEVEVVFDSFPYPEDDSDPMTRLIYHLVKHGVDSTVNKELWLDSLYEEVFYVGSELNEKKINTDAIFLSRAFNILAKLNKAHPRNDFLFGLRSVLYYWLENYEKSIIFTDEALGLNPNCESAIIVRAAMGQIDNHIPYAKELYNKVETIRPGRDFITYNIGTLNYTDNQFTTAIEYYSKLIAKKHRLTPEINFRIGHSYILLGNDDVGCEYLRASEKERFHRALSIRTRLCK
ncbi:MAG: LysM peptidoglycan-binding domain-containing protein [Chitinophagales bacterium]|jgi:LysM repeat protein|nr:LysM peptidoglycan-binding domain-containing protein [Sphingobacteriales bacterium]